MDYLHDDNKEKDGKYVLFEFEGLKPGAVYDCRVSYSKHANRATNIPVEANSDVMKIEAVVNQQKEPDIDGLFVSIGLLRVGDDGKANVKISAENTNGYVIVDAVQLLPQTNNL